MLRAAAAMRLPVSQRGRRAQGGAGWKRVLADALHAYNVHPALPQRRPLHAHFNLQHTMRVSGRLSRRAVRAGRRLRSGGRLQLPWRLRAQRQLVGGLLRV